MVSIVHVGQHVKGAMVLFDHSRFSMSDTSETAWALVAGYDFLMTKLMVFWHEHVDHFTVSRLKSANEAMRVSIGTMVERQAF